VALRGGENVHRIALEKGGKRLLRRTKNKWEGNIKMVQKRRKLIWENNTKIVQKGKGCLEDLDIVGRIILK
jgi:hypothetical protein